MRLASAAPLLGGLACLVGVGGAATAHAQLVPGTVWERTDAEGKGIVLTVEACCQGGLRLSYRSPPMAGQPAATMSVDSPMNGADAPVVMGGQPTTQTMAITRVDAHHYTAVGKMGGQPIGRYSGVVAADDKSMTVESTMQRPGGPPRKIIETWVRK